MCKGLDAPGFCSRQMGQIWPNDSALGVELTVSPTPDSNHQKVVHFTSQNHVVNPCVNLKLGMVYTNYAPTPTGDGLLNRAAASGFISSMEPCGETRFVAPTGSLWLGNIIYGYNIAPKCSLLVSENRVPIYFPSLGWDDLMILTGS